MQTNADQYQGSLNVPMLKECGLDFRMWIGLRNSPIRVLNHPDLPSTSQSSSLQMPTSTLASGTAGRQVQSLPRSSSSKNVTSSEYKTVGLSSVTRFGNIEPVLQFLALFGNFLRVHLLFGQHFQSTLAKIFYFSANLRCCKCRTMNK